MLAGTEFWDRVSFYGMQALLVLYMVEHLLLPGRMEQVAGLGAFRSLLESLTGPLTEQALAFQIFGLYVGLVSLMPLAGGLLGDRVLGRRRSVVLGGILMSAGHFCMAFDSSFLIALALLTTGAGCLRGNLTAQVGSLYASGDPRRGDAFQIYAASISFGAFVAPLISGALGRAFGWHYGFGFAGLGMLIGLAVYLLGERHLPPEPPRAAGVVRLRLTPAERRVVWVLSMLVPALACYWVAQTQIWNVYNVWARDHLDLVVAGWTIPVPWLQSLLGLAPLVAMPLVVAWWRRAARRGREPDELRKLVIGCLMFGAATVWLAAADAVFGDEVRVPLWWALAFHTISAVAWVYFAPTSLAVFARCAPAPVNAFMIGVFALATFFGSLVSGRLGALYERLEPGTFWLLHAAIVTIGGLVILTFAGRLRRELPPA